MSLHDIMPEIRSLAADIDRFSYDFDPYEYNDTVENSEQSISQISSEIASGDTDGIERFLEEIVEADELPENVDRAKELHAQLAVTNEQVLCEKILDLLPEAISRCDFEWRKPAEIAKTIDEIGEIELPIKDGFDYQTDNFYETFVNELFAEHGFADNGAAVTPENVRSFVTDSVNEHLWNSNEDLRWNMSQEVIDNLEDLIGENGLDYPEEPLRELIDSAYPFVDDCSAEDVLPSRFTVSLCLNEPTGVQERVVAQAWAYMADEEHSECYKEFIDEDGHFTVPEDLDLSNTPLDRLCSSQGCVLADAVNGTAPGFFAESLRSELAENTGGWGDSIVVLATLDLDQMCKATASSWEQAPSADELSFAPETKPVIGLYSGSQGSGGALGIELEKEWSFSMNDIEYVVPDNYRDQRYNPHYCGMYTPSEVFGLVPEAWDTMPQTKHHDAPAQSSPSLQAKALEMADATREEQEPASERSRGEEAR